MPPMMSMLLSVNVRYTVPLYQLIPHRASFYRGTGTLSLCMKKLCGRNAAIPGRSRKLLSYDARVIYNNAFHLVWNRYWDWSIDADAEAQSAGA